jgi:hypothetical protein
MSTVDGVDATGPMGPRAVEMPSPPAGGTMRRRCSSEMVLADEYPDSLTVPAYGAHALTDVPEGPESTLRPLGRSTPRRSGDEGGTA